MCFNGLCKKEPEKKSNLGKVFVSVAAIIGFGTLIYFAVKYLFAKYHNSCCALCSDDYDDCGCDFDDCDCGFDCCDCNDDNPIIVEERGKDISAEENENN